MRSVVGEARVSAETGHAMWAEPFNGMFAQVAGFFRGGVAAEKGRPYLLGLLSGGYSNGKTRDVAVLRCLRAAAPGRPG
jgi:hypothetical protein